MSTDTLDPAIYTRSPIFTIAGGITLARALAEACPKGMPAPVKKSLKRLQATTDKAQDAWAARQREVNQVSEEDTRALDQETDAAWSALRSRLQAYATLPAQRYPKAGRAAELVTLLFGPEGLSFLKDPYPLQWSGMDTILRRIDEDKLQKDIDHLAGPEFLDQIRALHPRYGAMVKAMLRRDDGSSQNLLDHVRAIQQAIVSYATQVCATVDEDEPATLGPARDALRPLDQFRAATARRAEGTPTQAPDPGADGKPEGKGESAPR